MADEMPHGGADDLRALLGDGPIPFPPKTVRPFQPWHRPRKQYVRRVQWAREIGFLARDMGLANGEFRYLTLPGNDLLDIRHLAETICTPHEVNLRYLGFNAAAIPSSSAQAELNAAQFSIKGFDHIHPESEVFPGDFRLVGNSRSVPWQRVRRAGPFHAINLDLCGGFAGPERPGGIPNYFTALQVLLENQRGADEDFLLFITTRMDSDSVDIVAKEKLARIAQSIYDTCRSYADEFRTSWGLSGEGLRISDAVGAAEVFMLGLTQWIVSRGIDAGLKASVKSLMTYRAGSEDGDGDDDIVSLAIRFKPDPFIQPDPHGLARPVVAQQPLAEKECAQSVTIPSRVSNRVRVDEILKIEAEEFERCVRESSELLGASGYDASSYHDWVMLERERYTRGTGGADSQAGN